MAWRVKLKTLLFLTFPWVFRRTKAYAYWNRRLLAGRSYADWIRRREKPEFANRPAIAANIRRWPTRPRFLLILPLCDTCERALASSIESVLAQSYPDWKLRIVITMPEETRGVSYRAESERAVKLRHDTSEAPNDHTLMNRGRVRVKEAENIAKTYSAKNPRINVIVTDEVPAPVIDPEQASGEWIAVLYPGDRLAEHALYFLSKVICYGPSMKVVYTDEDQIDSTGRRHSPHFKPDWNPDLFYARDYVAQLAAFRADLLSEAGLLADATSNPPDQNLLIRCLRHLRNEEVAHVPWVLYHRLHADANPRGAPRPINSYALRRKKALQDALCEPGRAVLVEAGMLHNSFRIRFPLPNPRPLVTLIIPTRDRVDLVRNCVRSILTRTEYEDFELIVIDNQSLEEETMRWFAAIREHPRVRVLAYDGPFNYSAINNFGVSAARGEIVGLINNDIEVINVDWLGEMVAHACRPDIGCVGAKLYYGDGHVQHAGILLGIRNGAGHGCRYAKRSDTGYFGRLNLVQNLSAVTAASLVVRRTLYLELGGLDEKNLAIDFNDVDFCLRALEAGYRNLWTPYAELYHHESASRGSNDSPEKRQRHAKEQSFLVSRWANYIEHDPAYNPNLTRNAEDYSLG